MLFDLVTDAGYIDTGREIFEGEEEEEQEESVKKSGPKGGKS